MSVAVPFASPLCRALLLGTLLSGALADHADELDTLLERFTTLPLPEPLEPKVWPSAAAARVDPRLLELAHTARSGSGADLTAKALALDLGYADERIAVTLVARSPDEFDDLLAAVRARGGEITATFETTVFAQLPVGAIDGLERIESLDYASPQGMLRPLAAGRSPTEGVKTIGVERLHQAGITGRGVKVGILDFGFQHYRELQQAGALPPPKATRSFARSRNMDNNEVHGTACAEIIHAMAPEADLYLAAIDGDPGQIMAAAQWLVQQGVDIISFSGGGHFGPHSGTHLLDRLVDQLVRQSGGRLLWVNAAGNEGSRHWSGLARDADGNGFIDIPLPGRSDNFGIVLQPGGGPLRITVVWDDWGEKPETPGASQDLDAELYALDARGQPVLVAASRELQRGRGAPIEMIGLRQSSRTKPLVLALRVRNLNRAVKVHVFVDGISEGAMRPGVPDGSVGIPATARLALAVGAVDVRNRQLESYSSQGPTDDGRLKPEISGADNTLSLAYRAAGDGERFPGTSAACPHVSGYAALLKQLLPGLGRDELVKRIAAYAEPMGSTPPNNQFGYGHVSARRVDPIAGGGSTPPVAGTPPPAAGTVFQPILDLLKGGGERP